MLCSKTEETPSGYTKMLCSKIEETARAHNKSCAVKVAARGMWEAYFYDIKCEVSLHLCSPSVIFLSIVPQTFKICCAEVQNQFMTSYIVFPE